MFSEIFLEQKIEETTDNITPKSMEEEDGVALQVVELEYINYSLDKTDINPDAAGTLNKLIAFLK